MGYLVGVDIGGTFTDCAIVDDGGAIAVGKAPTTPEDPSEGFFAAVEVGARGLGLSTEELLRATDRLAHATTVAINAVVTRRGARVGLLATRGHGDSIRIMDNAGRATGVPIETALHFPSSNLPEPFVTREHTVEVTERIDYAGEVVVPLKEDEVSAGLERLLADGVESIAISFLWSFMNPAHELRAAELIRAAQPGLDVSLSHRVASRVGEYPRTVATVLNAYVAPLMANYTKAIEERAAAYGYGHGVLFMQCAGGLARGERSRDLPVQTLQSGPVAGVIGTSTFAGAIGRRNVITTDMGGTTLDVSVIADGRALLRDEFVIDQHTAFVELVDVQSIGAGGGSIAWVDPVSRSLRVGPQSAGADPGPACYGRGGTEPTVTDADLVLGVLDPDNFLGGRLALDVDAAHAAVGRLGDELGLGLDEAAAGIVRVVDERMGDLIRSMTVQRGLDPRRFSLYAFGGGGGSHAGLYTKGLGVGEFVVPLADTASVWSALGVAVADLVGVYEQPLFLRAEFDPAPVAAAFAQLEERATKEIALDRAYVEEFRFERFAKCKYGLQVYEVDAEVPAGELDEEAMHETLASFERNYERRFGAGAGYREAGVVLTGLRLRVHGRVRKPRIAAQEPAAADPAAAARRGERDVYWHELGRRVPTPIWEGSLLLPCNELAGPAIVELPDTTVVVRPAGRFAIDAYGNAIVGV